MYFTKRTMSNNNITNRKRRTTSDTTTMTLATSIVRNNGTASSSYSTIAFAVTGIMCLMASSSISSIESFTIQQQQTRLLHLPISSSMITRTSKRRLPLHHHYQATSTTQRWSHNNVIDQHNDGATGGSSVSSSLIQNVMSNIGSGLLVLAIVVTSIGGFPGMSMAENELSAKYGSKGFDTSLVDQTCLINQCSIQAKACLQDDPSCRKGLTCTAKCLGDNACITGCMARYGNENLDNLLKCTIEDNECIKIAILPGGADEFGTEPQSPMPVVNNFNIQSMTGSWYKVIGYNPNYDCYACQRNTFSTTTTSVSSSSLPQLRMDVEFSMPHLLPDGSPPPPSSIRESLRLVNNNNANDVDVESSMQSIGLNDYSTHETMIFDQGYFGSNNNKRNNRNADEQQLVLNQGTPNELSYRRTAHSEGEMFGLKFWENWYLIGENDPGEQEFKFVYYNGKTRQNTYNGAFVYSRTKELSPASMKKVYQIASDAGMDPDQFCRIRNGCFPDEPSSLLENGSGGANQQLQQQPNQDDFFRGILASTRISQLLGVEPVAARDTIRKYVPTAKELTPEENLIFPSSSLLFNSAAGTTTGSSLKLQQRPWWNEVGDYLENPHRHFQAMDNLRVPMIWPDDVKSK